MANSKREHRVDFLRGLALAVIFINHVPGNVYERWTLKNFGFSDAAEVFVILAGFASAYAYFGPFSRGDRIGASLKAIKRAWVLYLSHITTTVAAIALFCAAALFLEEPGYLNDRLIGVSLKPVLDDPVRGFVGLATMAHQLGYFNILPMYMGLLLMLPAIMWLASRSLALLIACSLALQLASAAFLIDLPNYPLPGGWFFNPFAWQLLFVIGFVLGQWRREERNVPFQPWLLGLCLVYLVLAYWWWPFDWLINRAGIAEHSALWGFDKTYVAWPRLLHVLALAYAVTTLLSDALARLSPNNPITAMGRHSLPVFCVGSLLSMVGAILRIEWQDGFLADTIIIFGGLFLLAALARFLDRDRPPSATLRERKDFALVPSASMVKDATNARIGL